MDILMPSAEEQVAVNAAYEILRREGSGTDPLLFKHLEAALQQRIKGFEPGSVQNTYLKDFEIPQIILFDILANRFPLVVEAQRIVSEALADSCRNNSTVCIIDLGIGRGVQVLKLLERLNEEKGIRKVIVIGVELIADALGHTQNKITAASGQWHFEVVFHPFLQPLEQLNAEKIYNLIPERDTFVLVNASLSLHHIQSGADRDALFQKIASWHPHLFTLIEPNVFTFTDDYGIRLPNACEHFSALYQYTDTLPLKEEEKSGLKNFFSNDFFDPIALPDSHRFEKLERGEQWIERITRSGMHTTSMDKWSRSVKIDNIQIDNTREGYINFRFKKTDLLSIIAFNGKQ